MAKPMDSASTVSASGYLWNHSAVWLAVPSQLLSIAGGQSVKAGREKRTLFRTMGDM